MENRAKPTIGKIIQVDYISLLAIIIPAVLWVLYIAITYFGFLPGLRGRNAIQEAEGAPFFFTLGIVSLIVCLPLLLWRIRSIQTVFAKGAMVPGKITNIHFYRDRGRVDYTYIYEGQSYESGNGIHKSKKTAALRIGDYVTLVLDRQNPQKAFIQEMFL